MRFDVVSVYLQPSGTEFEVLERSIRMGVIYTQGSDPATLEPAQLSESLSATVREVMPWLASLSDIDACRPESAGKWSTKHVIGHLTDSAVNNLDRIVRMQLEPGQHLPGYDQASWVRVQHYDERNWKPECFGDFGSALRTSI